MEPTNPASEDLKNKAAFFVFSFVSYAFAFGAEFAAAEDVLASTNLQTSIVYVCDFGPYFVGAVFLPVFMDKLRPLSRVLATVLLEIVGIILMAVPGTLAVKITGICLISFGSNFADVTLLPMATFYEEITTRAYTAGAGLGAGFGVIYYTSKPINCFQLYSIWVAARRNLDGKDSATHADSPERESLGKFFPKKLCPVWGLNSRFSD